MIRIFKLTCVFALSFLALPAASHAQIASGSGDVAFSFGYANVNGFTSDRHYFFGGSAAYNFIPYVAAGFEYTYTPLGSETLSVVTDSAHQQTYGGFARLSLAHARVTPYLVAGAGAVHEQEIFGTNLFIVPGNQSGYYYAIGGGTSIFATRHWGFRPEIRYEHQQFAAANPNLQPYGQRDFQLGVQLFYTCGGR